MSGEFYFKLPFPVYCFLDGSDVDANMKLPISIEIMWFNEIRNVKCLRASMADTHEFIVAGVKDNESAVNSNSLCPRLLQYLFRAIMMPIFGFIVQIIVGLFAFLAFILGTVGRRRNLG